VRVWKQKEWNYDANPLKNNAQNSARNARISKLMKQATIIKARGNSNLTWGKQTEASRGEIFKIRMGAIAFGIKDHSNSRKTIKCIYTIRVRGIPMKTSWNWSWMVTKGTILTKSVTFLSVNSMKSTSSKS